MQQCQEQTSDGCIISQAAQQLVVDTIVCRLDELKHCSCPYKLQVTTFVGSVAMICRCGTQLRSAVWTSGSCSALQLAVLTA